jgi:transposase
MSRWRRLRDWHQEGIWDLMHFALLSWLACYGEVDWSRAVVDSCSVRAVCGGTQTGPNPTDRAKRGSKRHLICDAQGVPLAIRLTGANRNDSQEALALVDAVPPLQGESGRPRRRPACVQRPAMMRHPSGAACARHILPLLAMRRTKNGSGLGQSRWVVERTSHGRVNSAVSASATTKGPTSMRRSSRLAVHGSAGSRCGRLDDRELDPNGVPPGTGSMNIRRLERSRWRGGRRAAG